VHEQPPGLALHLVALLLAGVVGDVVEQPQIRLRQQISEHIPGEMGEDLAVGEGAVDGRAHGAQVAPTHRGIEGCTGQLPVRQTDSMVGGREGHGLQKLAADLVPQTAGAAVDAHQQIPLCQPESGGNGRCIELGDPLQLQVVVAGAQGPHLVHLPLLGPLRDRGGIGTAHPSPLLDTDQVRLQAIALLHRPEGTAAQHVVHLPGAQVDTSTAPHPRRDGAGERVRQPPLQWHDTLCLEAGMQGAHATGDVEAHFFGDEEPTGSMRQLCSESCMGAIVFIALPPF